RRRTETFGRGLRSGSALSGSLFRNVPHRQVQHLEQADEPLFFGSTTQEEHSEVTGRTAYDNALSCRQHSYGKALINLQSSVAPVIVGDSNYNKVYK
ncbi:MAG: hypothetical protein RR893_12965, partial [Clostridia bacterium]